VSDTTNDDSSSGHGNKTIEINNEGVMIESNHKLKTTNYKQ